MGLGQADGAETDHLRLIRFSCAKRDTLAEAEADRQTDHRFILQRGRHIAFAPPPGPGRPGPQARRRPHTRRPRPHRQDDTSAKDAAKAWDEQVKKPLPPRRRRRSRRPPNRPSPTPRSRPRSPPSSPSAAAREGPVRRILPLAAAAVLAAGAVQASVWRSTRRGRATPRNRSRRAPVSHRQRLSEIERSPPASSGAEWFVFTGRAGEVITAPGPQ
jgi:hypothetical protein